ncbi:leucine-rich repeat-containing protein 2mit [Cochliomyia hominivorax]
MSFKCQIFQTRLTFNKNVFVKNCDVRLIIILCIIISAILPIIKCAKLENPQIRLLINDDDLLQEKTNIHEAAGSSAVAPQHDNSGEHFNLYRSELKRLSYETIHRILRDENEPSYRREDTELRYYQKRSPSYEESHQLIKRSAKAKESILNLSSRNLTEFIITPQLQQRLGLVSSLDLSDNYIAQLNISLLNNISSLCSLILLNNSFTSIPLSSATQLRTLNLNNNLIKTSALQANIYLRNLYLSSNLIENLSAIPFSLLKNLESLDISHNQLQSTENSLFIERMHNLKHLNLAYNQLGPIYREAFYNLLSLNTLLLSHNNITDIDYETFLALPNLQYLDLSFNDLKGKSIRALQGITGLVALNIAFNPDIGPFMQEFVASWSLKELDASGTGLCQIPAALAQSVRSLKLTHNWLKVINCGDLDSYPLLQYLDLSFSHIEHIEDDALGRLEILEILMLDHNKLRKVPYSLPVSLEHLFLQNNDIMEIPLQAFQGLNNLKTLDLSHNKLLYLPDIMLPKLQTLNLQSSEIRGISQGIIHSLPKLNDLMLEDNPIKCSDLLGIAEWASTCRLRGEKDDEGEEGNEEDRENDENFVIRIQDLKNKFERMHNFYEQFGLNESYINNSLLIELREPTCVKESLSNGQTRDNSDKLEAGEDLKEIKLNQNLIIDKTLIKDNGKQIDLDKNFAEQKVEGESEDETAVKTINITKPIQTLPTTTATTTTTTTTTTMSTMQSSISNEKQTSNITTKSFISKPTTTTAVETTTTTNTIGETLKRQGNEEGGMTQEDIVVKSRFTNEMKTFDDHLTAIADVVVVATTTTTAASEIASKGNTPTESSSNMTEAVMKRSKEAGELLEDVQHKTISSKTFQTTKSKKWLKQKMIPLAALRDGREGGGDGEQNKEMNAAPQFIKSATFATPINTQTQATTITTKATLHATTTIMPEQHKQEITQNQEKEANKQWKEEEQEGERITKKFKEKDVHNDSSKDVKDIEGTTISKLQINLQNEKQQQHEIKTKIATTKEIKSLTIETPRNMQTKLTDTTTANTETITIKPTTTTTKTLLQEEIAKIILESSTQLTANKDNNLKPQTTTETSNIKTASATTNKSSIEKTTEEEEQQHQFQQTTTTTDNATLLRTFKTIDTTTIATSSLIKDKDLALNYNDKSGNKNTQINKTNSNILAMATTPTPTPTVFNIDIINTSSTIINTSTLANNKSNQIAKTATAINNITQHQQQQQQQQQHQNRTQLLEKLLPHSHQSLEKDVNVKCTQTNVNGCNTMTPATQNVFDIKPTVLANTLEQTTVRKTSTEIPSTTTTTTAAATEAGIFTVTTTTIGVIHKHEPLQLMVKDRHLIGTPLLMHKGENLMVTADELIMPTNNNHNAEQEENKNNNNTKELHDLETSYTMPGDSKNKHNLDTSQTTRVTTSTTTPTTTTASTTLASATAAAVASTPNRLITKTEHKINKSTNKKGQEDIKLQDPNPNSNRRQQDDLGKIKKPNYEMMKTKKPSLTMKKMTIITKQQHEDNPPHHLTPNEPLENEVHNKHLDNSHYQELKPQTNNLEHALKHSTVNTPLNHDSGPSANLLKQPHTFQHEHEMLIQQILQDQQAETHAKLTKTEQWSDLRKAESKENHPGLILLVSSGLFLVLLLGLMHVYRCDMPWRRHSPSHHLRPHQRQNHSFEDDSHSFLSYSEGMQKWHHSTRLEAPYNSPLHNLHVRELQKTSATEKPATVKSSASNYKPPSQKHSIMLNNSRSLSQSSTTTTSTASASSSAILDDESFYIEMTPDSGQYTRALQSELLPMELLNIAQIQTLDYQDQSLGDSQTSMEDDCVVHYQQSRRHQQQTSQLNSLRSTSDLLALPPSSSSATAAASEETTTAAASSLSVKPHVQTRKFGLW